jgi:hypothetical protein
LSQERAPIQKKRERPKKAARADYIPLSGLYAIAAITTVSVVGQQEFAWKQFGLDLGRRIGAVAGHAIIMIATIFSMALSELALNVTMGHDASIWDLFPLRYAIQTIDMLVLVRFAINVWRDFR